jgi:hypothetical protein
MIAVKFDIILHIFTAFNSCLISTGQAGASVVTGREYREACL